MSICPDRGANGSECSPFLLSVSPPDHDPPIAQQLCGGSQTRPVACLSRKRVCGIRSSKSLTLLSLDSAETLCQHRVSGTLPKSTHMFLQVLLVMNRSLAHVFTQPLERVLVEACHRQRNPVGKSDSLSDGVLVLLVDEAHDGIL